MQNAVDTLVNVYEESTISFMSESKLKDGKGSNITYIVI